MLRSGSWKTLMSCVPEYHSSPMIHLYIRVCVMTITLTVCSYDPNATDDDELH